MKTATGCWFYAPYGHIQLLDQAGTVRASTWYKQPYWLGEVVGRGRREPPAITLNQMQAHLEQQCGIQPQRR